MTDQDLVDLFLARSEEALPALQAQYGPYCRAVAARLLADRRDVDECLNDVWLAVWRAIPPARPERFKGWLAAIVRNRALAMGRENGRRPPTVDEAALELASCLPPRDDPSGAAFCPEILFRKPKSLQKRPNFLAAKRACIFHPNRIQYKTNEMER